MLDNVISNSLGLDDKLACLGPSIPERMCTTKRSPADGYMESWTFASTASSDCEFNENLDESDARTTKS